MAKYQNGIFFIKYNNGTTDSPAMGSSGVCVLMAYSSSYYVTMAYPFDNNSVYKKFNNSSWYKVSANNI